MPNKSSNRSAAVIARLLGTEGYSDFVHNQVERYWRKTVLRGSRRRARNLDKEFSVIMQKLSDADRIIVGKFIAVGYRLGECVISGRSVRSQ
jgi:hypothetical protein